MSDQAQVVTLRDLEDTWRPRVDSISLLAELEIDRSGIEDALRLVGTQWNTWGATTASRKLRASYPAVFVTALAGIASISYADGSLWPAVWTATGIRGDANTATRFGTLFEQCLMKLDLTTFPELDEEKAMRYVSRILLHAGVPVYCIDDWVGALETTSRQIGVDDPELIFERLNGRARSNRLFHIDKPVQRFIKYGGDYALDFLDRSLDLMRSIQAAEANPSSFGLPQRFVTRTIEVLRDAPTGRPVQQVRQKHRTARPTMRFDAYGLGVHIVLPPISSEGAVTWHVRFDEDGRRFVAPATSARTTQVVDVPVPSGVGRVDIDGPAPTTQFRLEQGKSPLLLFDESGTALPSSGHVRSTKLWAVHPSDQELVEGGQRILERLPSVHRWDGWTATRVDLTDATSIGLKGGRCRAIDHMSTPKVESDPLVDVRTLDDAPVYDDWPRLHLPPAPGMPWTVSIAIDNDEVGTQWVADVENDTPTSYDLSDLVPDNVGGVATITVRGPLGRGLRATVGVAPGLRVRTTPNWRSFADRGLSPAIVRITHPEGREEHFELGERDIDVQFHVEADTTLFPVVVRPAAMASQLVSDGEPVQWSHSTRFLAAEDLTERHSQLVVRFDPDGPTPTLEVCGPDGNLLQAVDPGATRSGGVTSFDLRRIGDTLANHPACTLLLRGRGRRDRVAVVRPRVLARGVELRPDGYGLQILNASTTGLEAGVYRHLDPTAAPVVLPVSDDGTALLPDELVDVGDLRISLRVEDPWAPQPWGVFPWSGPSVFDVDALSPSDPTGTIPALIQSQTPPPRDPTELAAAIEAYPLLDRFLDEDRAFHVRKAIRSVTEGEPALTVRALGRTGAEARDVAFASVNLGVMNRPLGKFAPDEVEGLLDRWAPLGVAAAGPHLRSNDRAWIADVIADKVGPAFCDLLHNRDDAALNRPMLEDEKLIELPDEILDIAFRAAGIVPSPLLDDDTQALAGRRLLEAIRDNDTKVRPLQREWENYVGQVLATVLEPHAPSRLTKGVRSRIQGAGWQTAPAASLALAAVARLDVRLPAEGRRLRNGWRFALGRLARTVPNLVAADLVMAEAVLLSEE